MLRSAYDARMILWQHGTPINVRWFRAFPSARFFPGAHRFGSNIWRTDKTADAPIGEQGGMTAWYSGSNSFGLVGRNHCGTDLAFLDGGVFGVTPGIVTDDTGVPDCCKPRAQFARGGGAGGGTAWRRTQFGTGGGAGGGTGFHRVEYARGGGAGGGLSFQTGFPGLQIGTGGGAGGGKTQSPFIGTGGGAGGGYTIQGGKEKFQIAHGGGAGGGDSTQSGGSTEITTYCCPDNPLPLTLTAGTQAVDSNCEVEFTMTWDEDQQGWYAAGITIGSWNDWRFLIRCIGTPPDPTRWDLRRSNGDTSFNFGGPGVIDDCDPFALGWATYAWVDPDGNQVCADGAGPGSVTVRI